MAWSFIGGLGTVGSTATTTTMTITTTIAGAANNVVFVVAAIVNPTSTNTTTSIVSGVSDSAGNHWVKAREFQAGGGAVASGAICSMWYSHLHNALSSGGTISVTHNNAAASTRRACAAVAFSIGAGASVRVFDSTFINASSAQSPLSLDVAIPTTTEMLRFRAVASESSLTTALTTTAGWSNLGVVNSGLAMSIRGEVLITAATTAVSNPTFTSTATDASVYAVFEESALMPAIML